MRSLFKKYRKCKIQDLHLDADIVDMSRGVKGSNELLRAASVSCIGDRDRAFREFLSGSFDECGDEKGAPVPAFEVINIPG